ncbi:hypothetical protein ACPPVO_37395 [Dactylosporangium sp. McL0621]|uniref:hypothetical protein n=1 Tax=Dactylosporangium sp. McL0621 TaxID=3415678 RepID=UPI003CF8547E
MVDSGKSTSGLQQLAWSASDLAPVDAAVAGGSLSSDGGPGLAQVYSHTNQ